MATAAAAPRTTNPPAAAAAAAEAAVGNGDSTLRDILRKQRSILGRWENQQREQERQQRRRRRRPQRPADTRYFEFDPALIHPSVLFPPSPLNETRRVTSMLSTFVFLAILIYVSVIVLQFELPESNSSIYTFIALFPLFFLLAVAVRRRSRY